MPLEMDMQENAATAFLIHGYLGAGKTTLARPLEVEQAAIRFTPPLNR
jgi:predicted kinase